MGDGVKTIREIRLHLESPEGLRRIAKVAFSRRDASIYLIPYGPRGEYFYGSRAMADGQTTDTFNFREQLWAESNPKLSIHETGQVHIYAAGRPRAGPLRIAPLRDLRGQHVATLRWDSVQTLSVYAKGPKITAPDIDVGFGVPDGVEAGALLIFANGAENRFLTGYVHFGLQVSSREGPPIFFGIAAVAKETFSDGGVTVLAGFDARKAGTGEADEFFVPARVIDFGPRRSPLKVQGEPSPCRSRRRC